MRWIILIVIVVIAIALATGYTGGAKDAASNYSKILSGRPAAQ